MQNSNQSLKTLKAEKARRLAIRLEQNQKRAEFEVQAAKWAKDPVAYCEQRLGLIVWDKLAEFLESVRDNRQTAVRSANGVGKTESAAALILWWLESFSDSMVIATGANFRVLRTQLFPRVHKYIRRNNLFPDQSPNMLEIRLPFERMAYAASVDTPEAIAGAHAPHLLQIVEEASGLGQDIADAIDGNATGDHDRRVYLFNPLNPSGPAYKWSTDPNVHLVHISALDHPNVKQGKNIIPGAVTRQSLEEKLEKWGVRVPEETKGAYHFPWLDDKGWYMPKDHRLKPRVLGMFPDSAPSALIPRDVLERAAKREQKEFEIEAAGCDPAFGGADENIIARVCEHGVLSIEAIDGKRIQDTAGALKNLVNEGISTAFDSGGGGKGIRDLLDEWEVEYTSVDFNDAASDPTEFANLKAEIYWKFKEAVTSNPDYFIPDDELFIQQASTVEIYLDDRGRIAVEKKKDYRKRMGMSPDRLEAVIIANYGLEYSGPSAPPSNLVSQPVRTSRYGKEDMS